jgi:hypothetical protein
MHHQNIVKIQHAFFSNESQTRNPEDALLNIVMDLIPSNVYRIIKYFKNFEQRVHPLLTKCYMY